MEKSETVGKFCKRTDFMAKLRARLEDIENGDGFGVFEGVQKQGFCAIIVLCEKDVVRLANVQADVSPLALQYLRETLDLTVKKATPLLTVTKAEDKPETPEPQKVERKKTK